MISASLRRLQSKLIRKQLRAVSMTVYCQYCTLTATQIQFHFDTNKYGFVLNLLKHFELENV